MQDDEQMPARDRDDLILLRVSIDERKDKLEIKARKDAERKQR